MATVYNAFRTALAGGSIDLANDTFYMAIVKATYTADADDADFSDDIAAHELDDAAGYPAGGVALTSTTLTEDVANDETTWDFDDVLFPISGAGASAVNGVVIYHQTTDIPVMHGSIPSHTPTGNNIRIIVPTGGALTLN